MRIQTSGSFDKITGIYSISICTDENRLITLDGLSRDDMLEMNFNGYAVDKSKKMQPDARAYFNFLDQRQAQLSQLNFEALFTACQTMSKDRTGAIIVLERNNSLEFLKDTGEATQIELTQGILEAIFFKNGPLHDGAILVKDNQIVATRVILPVTKKTDIPSRFGLRHRAAIGVSEKTDAVVLVLSEQTGKLSYFKDGALVPYKDVEALKKILEEDLLQ